MRIFALIAVLLSMFNVEVGYAKDKPLYGFCAEEGETYYCHYDEANHVWIDRSILKDMWVTASRNDSPESYAYWKKAKEGDRVPVKKIYKLELRKLYWKTESFEVATLLAAAHVQKGKRFVGVNVEAGTWPDEHKIWPHLGLTYVGTVAKESGYRSRSTTSSSRGQRLWKTS